MTSPFDQRGQTVGNQTNVNVPPATPGYNMGESIHGLTEGRIVHYVLPVGHHDGDHRPAIIVKVHNRQYPGDVDLQVFVSDEYDHISQPVLDQATGTYSYPIVKGMMYVRGARMGMASGSWHFIEPVD